jgi:hypothetical protein
MANRKTLFNDPAFEKTAAATYLANTLSLNQLLTIESLARSGKIKKIINGSCNSEQSEQIDPQSEQITKPEQIGKGRLKYMVID